MKKRILVIDDDVDILYILELVLLQDGFEPTLKRIGPTIAEVLDINPDLILLDVRIDGFPKSGVEICAEFKLSPHIAHIPVLLVSAEHNLSALAESCGADGYISKPFDIDGVVNKVKELLY